MVIVTFLAMTRFAAGEQLPLKIYTTVDGLPSDRIRSILLDSRGFLWLGTEDGVSRFDGYGFTNLTTSERVTAKAAGAYATADPSGNGEGQTFIGFANVTTDASCNATFGPLVFAVPPGQAIFTATATSPANNTSEFATAFPLGAPPPTPTPALTATPTPTSTPAGVPTPTATPIGPGSATVPMLSDGMLFLLGVALASISLLLLRKRG